jgi:antitoxin CcdA
MAEAVRRPTNLSLDQALVERARLLDVNLSRAAEAGLRDAVRAAEAAQWQEENRAALASSNAWVEANGLPLARFRMF